jgi:hypothetical protein
MHRLCAVEGIGNGRGAEDTASIVGCGVVLLKSRFVGGRRFGHWGVRAVG